MIDISVIMPVYNSELYLKPAIESILNQTFNNFEFIIINDGSTDQSASIIKSYLYDKRIIFIDRKENKRLVYTLNEGLRLAKGKYIARMDADDISYPERFYKQIQVLDSKPHIKLVGSSYTVFNETGVQIDHHHPKNPVEIAYKFISNTYFCHPSVMFSAEMIYEFGEYENVEAEDFRFFSKIVSRYPTLNIQTPLLYYREHGQNRSLTHKTQLSLSVSETARQNIKYYLINTAFQEKYYDYRFYLNTDIKQIFCCFFFDLVVIMKIVRSYKKPIYYLYGFSLVIKLVKENFKRGLNKIKKSWI